ncbi:unnamed protein product, partial [Heligmosomoides polygyrus]
MNAAVYAVGKAITSVINDSGAEKTGYKHQQIREAKGQRDTLLSFISTLANELARRERTERNPPSEAYLKIAELSGARKTGEVLRLLRKLKDELHISNQEIQKNEDAARRYKERKRGYPAVAREPRDMNIETPVEEIREYWRGIVGTPQSFTPTSQLIDWARREGRAPYKNKVSVTEEEWKSIFSKIRPWKATGPDGIQGYWWKHLPEAKLKLKKWCELATRNPGEAVPNWLCRGKVVLIPKGKAGPKGPGDFRPIACLNTCYKVLTAMMARKIHQCIESRFPTEQVAMRKGVWGCTHAHILDQTICKDARWRNKELHMLWVDMTKAFDSVSHKAIKWILTKLGSTPLQIKNGIMQGDTLSPLLFCIAIMPISDWIRTHITPYQTAT